VIDVGKVNADQMLDVLQQYIKLHHEARVTVTHLVGLFAFFHHFNGNARARRWVEF
jgi:hypothetical protein